MKCDEMSKWLDAYIDNELDLEHATLLEAHTTACPRCASLVEERSQLRRSLADGGAYHTVPETLRRAIQRDFGLEAASRQRAKVPAWSWLALAASVVLAVTLVWSSALKSNSVSDQQALLRDAISSHIRSLMAAHLADIAISDQHTVKPWFAGKLDFSPKVTDYTKDGFPLQGGRLDYLDGRPVAAVVYGRRSHVINLFSFPDSAGKARSPQVVEDRGYHAVSWSDGRMQFCAVSDVNSDDLMMLVRLIQTGGASELNVPQSAP